MGKTTQPAASYLYYSSKIIQVIKSRRMKWVGHVACTGERRGAYRLLGETRGKGPIVRPKHRWKDSIKI